MTIVYYLLNLALVCCTFTDLKVLSGPDYDKCFYYYGANKSKVGPIHEVYIYKVCKNALRIALYTCSAAASR
jgi:tRNA G26 N,N-dimethylase Trm1